MSVAEMSIAGTVMVRLIHLVRGTSAPGRANTTTSAKPGSASASCQRGSSRAASAPNNNKNRFPGSRRARARKVETV